MVEAAVAATDQMAAMAVMEVMEDSVVAAVEAG